MKRRYYLLLAIAVLPMVGSVTGLPLLAGLGALSVSSPASRVFSRIGRTQPFTETIMLEDGSGKTVPLGQDAFRWLEGPYLARAPLAGAISYGERIPPSMRRSLLEAVFCVPPTPATALGVGMGPYRLRYVQNYGDATANTTTSVECTP